MSKPTRDDQIVNIRLVKIKSSVAVTVLILVDNLPVKIFEVSEDVIGLGQEINEQTETNTTTRSRCNITGYQLC